MQYCNVQFSDSSSDDEDSLFGSTGRGNKKDLPLSQLAKQTLVDKNNGEKCDFVRLVQLTDAVFFPVFLIKATFHFVRR